MVIYGVYIVSKSGGLIFNHDHNVPKVESECVFNKHPLDLKLVNENKKVVVSFGLRDGVASEFIFTLSSITFIDIHLMSNISVITE